MFLGFGGEAWLAAAGIFLLRVINMALDTLRVMLAVRDRRLLTWIIGFIETVIFVVLLTAVIQDLTNILNIVAYAGGFATGNVLGIWIEEKLAIGHTNLRIISPKLGAAIVERLRKEGYGVTEIPARGKDGSVTLVNASVVRKKVAEVQKLVQEVDPDAMMTAEITRPMSRGFWR
jgi:uncharacterized protein YebE (UPF0316 family)